MASVLRCSHLNRALCAKMSQELLSNEHPVKISSAPKENQSQ